MISNEKNNWFDIVIPTYNRINFIKTAIDSIVAQRYDNWNLFILDNASTDGTADFVKPYLSDKINYVRNDTNIGMIRNWKKAVGETGSAENVVLLSDDDELCDNFLLKANEAINKYPGMGMYSSAVYIKNSGQTYTWSSEYINWGDNDFLVSPAGQNLHYYLGGNPISPAAMMIRRQAFKTITDFHLATSKIWSFDRYWWAQLALTNSIVFCSVPTAIYHQHQFSESSNINKNNFDKISESFKVSANIINMAYNLDLITVEILKNEIDKLKIPARLDLLSALILFGHKVFYEMALSYFKNNKKKLLVNESLSKKFIYNLLGLKITSFFRMYSSRT